MEVTGLTTTALRWYRVDLHIHTPASEDYVDKSVSYLDILREAERRGLDMIAITDHNTIAGYEALLDEVSFLQRLESLGRLNEQEKATLKEYRTLLSKITVLPGFELTTRFGAHVLGLFSPKMRNCISRLKALLNQLGVSYEKMGLGTTSVPGTQAFLEVYKIIHEAGGIVIAAHVNSPTGVLAIASNMPTGAARVSATQSPYLHALEFAGFYSNQHHGFASPRWYDGSNLGYERRMHCIQGSDAHRLQQDPASQMHRWGIGDRPTEVLLPEPTFEALLSLFQSTHFERVRVPYASDVTQYNLIADVRTSGNSDDQILVPKCVDNLEELCRHVVALANGQGGSIFLGLDPDPEAAVIGLADAPQQMRAFQQALAEMVFPRPDWSVDIVQYEGQDIVHVEVSEAQHKPCYLKRGAEREIYVRRSGQTVLATHGDIIEMIHGADEAALAVSARLNGRVCMLAPGIEQPKSGVEVVGETLRGDMEYFRIVDLRTNRESQTSEHTATSVWLYAIEMHKEIRNRMDDLLQKARWHGQIGLWRIYRQNEIYDQNDRVKCDLVYRGEDGHVERVFYAVAVNWLGAAWEELFECEPPAGVAPEPMSPDRRVRWRGNLGVEALYRSPKGLVCNLAFRDRQGQDWFYPQVSCHELSGEWLDVLTVELPRSGLEVVEVYQNGADPLYKFHNLGNQHVESRLWVPEMLKEGSLRHYALRMHLEHDRPLDEGKVHWLGNIGYLRRSYTTVDLVYRDPSGVDHIYYGARWNDLHGAWLDLLDY